MSLSLGEKLRIRSMIYVAAEPISFFWPMRNFIHHNPLHGLEALPFSEAVASGERLFHGHGFLPRHVYQLFLQQGKVDEAALAQKVEQFVLTRSAVPGIDLHTLLMKTLTEMPHRSHSSLTMADVDDVYSVIQQKPLPKSAVDKKKLAESLRSGLLTDRPVYEAVDVLHGTKIGEELDELVIKSCLDFFDEGQSVWEMPDRHLGFFRAWRQVATRNGRLFVRGLHINRVLDDYQEPEEIIAYVMKSLGVREENWVSYFTRELARLHGWAGFIRWRSSAKRYYWNRTNPGDLVDFIAVRLTLAYALLCERAEKNIDTTADAIANAIDQRLEETYLRNELYGKKVIRAFALRIEKVLARRRGDQISQLFDEYVLARRTHEAESKASHLQQLAELGGSHDAMRQLSPIDLGNLLSTLRAFEDHEGMLWLCAMESQAINHLLEGISLETPAPREKRPFAQALFCIDVRSERIRRHLESVGDYQTFGIAGFFGVPLSFMGLGKGSETHLCPVLLTPKHLVLEMTAAGTEDISALTALEHVLHELKQSVLAPFVTVEAVGLLFGLDLVGKTLIPRTYNQWRKRIYERQAPTHQLLDKLSGEQADSIVRAIQRAIIVQAVAQEFDMQAEDITDDMVRELRESALGGQQDIPEFTRALALDQEKSLHFIQRLRKYYRIDPAFAQLQREQLGRIGFSIEEQTTFVSQALLSIGLVKDFSRFVLLVGHGSMSENNPYESALDCGACGGNHGLVNARALAQMANKPMVRRKLKTQGIEIADDVWFLPALHNTTTDKIELFEIDRMPSSHIVYIDRLRTGLLAASRLCAQERLPSLQIYPNQSEPLAAYRSAQRNAMDWSQVRPEWGLSRNAYFIIGRRALTQQISLDGRAFMHSYDYQLDRKRRLLENILTGPLVVGQWINMEHYFSTVDNERFGSGSKVYHNVAGRFAVMSGNLSDLRTGLPAQTVLENGLPYHEPVRLITVIEAPLEHAHAAVESVVTVKYLVRNGWIRLLVIDPEQQTVFLYEDGNWNKTSLSATMKTKPVEESIA